MQITKNITSEEIADKVLLYFDNVSMTDFDDAANEAGFTYKIIDELNLSRKVAFAKLALSDSLGYIEQTGNGGTWFFLTDLGGRVKNAGGHFTYLKKNEQKASAESARQEQKDKSDKIDLKIKEWTYKAKYAPFIFSGLAFIGMVISIIISIKAINSKKDKSDLQQVQQNLKELTDRVKSQDSLLRVDTLLKKHK